MVETPRERVSLFVLSLPPKFAVRKLRGAIFMQLSDLLADVCSSREESQLENITPPTRPPQIFPKNSETAPCSRPVRGNLCVQVSFGDLPGTVPMKEDEAEPEAKDSKDRISTVGTTHGTHYPYALRAIRGKRNSCW